jgi:hypothetical protein
MSIVFGRARVDSNLLCGFIPSNIASLFQTSEPPKHREAAQSLLRFLPTIPIDSVDFPAFIIFSQPFFLNEDFTIINCFTDIFKFLITKIGPICINSLEEFLAMILTPLTDSRRSVRILIFNLIYLFIETSQSLDFLKALVPFFEHQPLQTKVELLDFTARALQHFPASEDLFINLSSVLILSCENENLPIKNAAIRLLSQIILNFPDSLKFFPASLLSQVDQTPFVPVHPRITKPGMNPRNLILRPRVNRNNSVRTRSADEPLIVLESDPIVIRPPDSVRERKSPRPRDLHRLVVKKSGDLTIDNFCERLQNNNWEVQNEAIVRLMELVLERPQFVSQNLRIIVFGLIPIMSSSRSGLAESALSCLREIVSWSGDDVTPFFETLMNHLFTIIVSNRPVVGQIAADCVSVILNNIDHTAALEFLGRDPSSHPPEVREQLAIAIDGLCSDCEEPSQLLPAITTMLLDSCDNTREHAQSALVQLNQKFDDLLLNSTLMEMDQKRRLAIVNALDFYRRRI